MITVITPHARPEFAATILANFERQAWVDARLLVVVNGESADPDAPFEGRGRLIGAALSGARQPGDRITVIRSGNHQADAMNAGLDWLRGHGGGTWARFDDDDYYGPDYLADTLELLASSSADVVGKPWAFVLHDEGLFRFLCSADGPFTGGTLAGRSADVLPFEKRSDDDVDWCARMRAQGARLQSGKAWGYCYDRRTRPAARVISGGLFESRFAWGACWAYGQKGPEAVDDRGLVPLTFLPAPTDEEIHAYLGAE